jgi:hypothetical protein
MCIACEMAFMDMLEALPPDERELILRAQFGEEAGDATAPGASFTCEPADGGEPPRDGHEP